MLGWTRRRRGAGSRQPASLFSALAGNAASLEIEPAAQGPLRPGTVVRVAWNGDGLRAGLDEMELILSSTAVSRGPSGSAGTFPSRDGPSRSGYPGSPPGTRGSGFERGGKESPRRSRSSRSAARSRSRVRSPPALEPLAASRANGGPSKPSLARPVPPSPRDRDRRGRIGRAAPRNRREPTSETRPCCPPCRLRSSAATSSRPVPGFPRGVSRAGCFFRHPGGNEARSIPGRKHDRTPRWGRKEERNEQALCVPPCGRPDGLVLALAPAPLGAQDPRERRPRRSSFQPRKTPEDPAEIAGTVEVVPGDVLRRSGARTVAEAIQDVVGIDTGGGSDNGPRLPNIGMWGLKEFDALLVTVDGIPVGDVPTRRSPQIRSRHRPD